MAIIKLTHPDSDVVVEVEEGSEGAYTHAGWRRAHADSNASAKADDGQAKKA